MKKMDMIKVLKVVVPIILALVSVFVLSKYATSTDYHASTIQALDEKKETVMELTAASTAASAAITLIPGDAATPIAEEIAELSSYFLMVVCALYLEKYLLTITGYAAFVILIPAACILFAANVFLKKASYKALAKKLAIFGLAIVLVIPASVGVANMIETTYQASINETIETAKETTESIEENLDEEDESVWAEILSKVENGVSTVTAGVEKVLNNFIEALAVMIITSCVIPIVVLVFFVWLVKMILGIDVQLPRKELKLT